MKRIFFVSFFLCLLSGNVFSQQHPDQDTNLAARLKKAKTPYEIGKAHTDVAGAYYYRGDFAKALKIYFRGIEAIKGTDVWRARASAYQGIGSVYMETGKYDDALSYLKKARELFAENKDSVNWARALITTGNVYYYQVKDSLCELYYLEALRVVKPTNDSAVLTDVYKNLGALYTEMGNREDTLRGLDYLKKSLNYIRTQDTLNRFDGYLGLAELYTYSGYLFEAKPYIDKCTDLLPRIKALQAIDDYYYCLHDYYRRKGEFQQSLQAYIKYKKYQDSLLNIKSDKQLNELNIKYQTAQKEQQITSLNAQKERQKLVLIVVVLLVVLFVVLTGILFVRYKRRQQIRKEKELQGQKEAERIRIARDMHDEIGAGLTRIVMRSEQVKHHVQLGSELKNGVMESLEKMTVEAGELSRNIGEIIWALNPKNDNLDTLFAYIRNYAFDYLDQAGIDCKINFPDTIPNVPVAPELRRNIFLIVKESLNNIVKYAGATEVEITLVLNEKQFSLSVKDNGKGMSTDIKGNGNGLENMRKRTEESGGTFSVKNEPGGVTIRAENVPLFKNPTKV